MDESKRTFRDRYPKPPKPKMLASVVANTVSYAVARGINMSQIGAATGLSNIDLLDPNARLSQDLLPAIWRLVSKAYPGKALTLHMASAVPLLNIGSPLVYGTQYAENFREALYTLVRYRWLLSDLLHLTLIESSSEAILQVHHPMDSEDGGCGAELGLALGSRFVKEIIGINNALVRVEFTHTPFASLQVYENFFCTPVHFQKPYNALVFRKEALELPTKNPDADLFGYIQGQMDLLKESLGVATNPPELSQIREAIAFNAEHSEYGAEALAKRMNMSLRALQRLTQEYGITVRQLLDETREANARQLLKNPQLTIEAVSELLGYSEDRSFRRAFKRWTGLTPAQFQKQQQ